MDPRLAIEALAALAMFFAALWIRGIRTDVHELVRQVANHGERLAVLESRVSDLRGKE